ncbi:hypothetical protein LCGC14_0466450 [marine sediment metagenome]|uniref:Uncharacterized protein n=1 Tax=marine sediment metagenome TaxID=412755 RepID=A0A0F9SDN0_9ZZZZ
MDKKFRNIFVTEATQHDLSALKQYAEKIILLSTGYEEAYDLGTIIYDELINRKFDPCQDVILPIGKVTTALMVGIVLGRRFDGKIEIAIYQNNEYVFI